MPGRDALQRDYDVITLSEVAEHLFEPAVEFERLGRLLKPGGWLGVMTCFQTDDTSFARWHYRRDPTHVVFYRSKDLRDHRQTNKAGAWRSREKTWRSCRNRPSKRSSAPLVARRRCPNLPEPTASRSSTVWK